jgi:hypothetical protein
MVSSGYLSLARRFLDQKQTTANRPGLDRPGPIEAAAFAST